MRVNPDICKTVRSLQSKAHKGMWFGCIPSPIGAQASLRGTLEGNLDTFWPKLDWNIELRHNSQILSKLGIILSITRARHRME